MEINLVEIWQAMGLPVRLVVIVLTIQAVACIAVAIDRIVLLARSGAASRRFAAEATPLFEAGRLDEVLALASRSHGSHLAAFMHAGLSSFLDRHRAGDDRARASDMARRALERKGESLSANLHRGMNVLASTGSTAPFVGLLGTVLGIIHAFKLISATGSGGIATIGAAIGEALVVTGYGLVVAIPAVLVFNWLSSRLQRYESGLVNAASELLDRLETQLFAARPDGERAVEQGGGPTTGRGAGEPAPAAALRAPASSSMAEA
ncbi:MAG: MotA/TolQ/ExbB proton channel family protein [Myxococcota bacterium]|nr:MotA/TolQ/ExbB proton channel family protein [Myxococcota bacterium]MDW8362058.1 MotA/TolQ/ExbB proton channel family protein [Myxococcales bacterium]